MSEEPSDFRYSQKALDEDAYAEAGPITDYPDGISIMPVSEGASWVDYGTVGVVTTHNTGLEGWQTISFGDRSGVAIRQWDQDEILWSSWDWIALESQLTSHTHDHIVQLEDDFTMGGASPSSYPEGFSIYFVTPNIGNYFLGLERVSGFVVLTFRRGSTYVQQIIDRENGNIYHSYWDGSGSKGAAANTAPLIEDRFDEAEPITSSPDGISIMLASTGANWGPNTGEAGMVETSSDGVNGVQNFTQYSNNTQFRRVYFGDAWSSWVNVAG